MRVVINGKVRDLVDGRTVSQVLNDLDLSFERLAVEYNARILQSAEYTEVVLQEGDTLEIVRFVGGG